MTRLIDADKLLESLKIDGVLYIGQPEIDAITNAPTIEADSGQAVDKKDTTLEEWLITNMPAGTIIGNPKWWAERIKRVAAFTIQKEIKFADCEFGKSVGMPEYTCVKQCQYADTSPQKRDWVDLTDVQWMNIVNYKQSYHGWYIEDAVHYAVKATITKLKEVNHD